MDGGSVCARKTAAKKTPTNRARRVHHDIHVVSKEIPKAWLALTYLFDYSTQSVSNYNNVPSHCCKA